ncbi:hypothetical protein RSAG8_11455, partial [Rhizoctonia solani AG-8 WAC10335]
MLSATAQSLVTIEEAQEEMGYFADRIFDGVAWQGLPPLDWSSIGLAIKSGNPPFSFSRTPGGLQWGQPLESWHAEEVDRMYTHGCSHQNQLQARDLYVEQTAFQWVESHVDEPFWKNPATTARNLYQFEESSYSLAIQAHHFRDDAYMPLSTEPRRWFDHSFIKSNCCSITASIDSLLYWTEINERLDPPIRELQDDDPPLFNMMPLHAISVPDFFNDFVIPNAVFDQLHDDHDDYNVHALWKFVVKQRALFIDGGTHLSVAVPFTGNHVLKDHRADL